MKMMTYKNKQRGAALIVGLVLLVVITVLAISGMNTATTELAMARNDQNYEYAFQAAETGLENILALGTFDTAGAPAVTRNINTHDTVVAQVDYEDWSIVPDKAFSLGSGSGVSAYHFVATATADSLRSPGNTTDRDASAVHTQAFYVVGPESPTL
ncbi:MAG: PilX N-terminal domain-containing pilus assembly protein [Gammaproteobacteria bacterium]|nr:PilX N-terminal domain-containing pilus assembly protein [Gammaproteobacteria bacterium]MDH5304209.1 PilX N-terminal domain-containing pilus assembly protein [Gammaproteobacteria bacterium]MDH5322903.1 PilX N-terminal domain-containing pilus assembly protein [Gammaproteobacteria bacterium]